MRNRQRHCYVAAGVRELPAKPTFVFVIVIMSLSSTRAFLLVLTFLVFSSSFLLPVDGFTLVPTTNERLRRANAVLDGVRKPPEVVNGDQVSVSSSEAEKDVSPSSPTSSRAVSEAFIRTWMSHRIVLYSAIVVSMAAWVTAQWPLIIKPTLRFNMLSGTIIFAVGDYGAQWLEYWTMRKDRGGQASSFDPTADRFLIAVILGAIWAGVGNPLVYATVESLLPGAGSVRRVLTKMLVTCSVLSTAGNYFTMMFRRVGQQLLLKRQQKNKTLHTGFGSILQSCRTSCNRDFPEVLRDDLKVWPAYDVLCYSIIPPMVRPITTALMATLWSMYMSIASAKSPPE